MSDIKLIEPTIEYAEDIWKFRQEIIDSSDNDKFAGCGALEQSASAAYYGSKIQLDERLREREKGNGGSGFRRAGIRWNDRACSHRKSV